MTSGFWIPLLDETERATMALEGRPEDLTPEEEIQQIERLVSRGSLSWEELGKRAELKYGIPWLKNPGEVLRTAERIEETTWGNCLCRNPSGNDTLIIQAPEHLAEELNAANDLNAQRWFLCTRKIVDHCRRLAEFPQDTDFPLAAETPTPYFKTEEEEIHRRLRECLEHGVSDWHLYCERNLFVQCYRIDGVRHTINYLPLNEGNELLRKICLLANIPPDLTHGNHEGRIVIDSPRGCSCRVSVIPGRKGPSCVVRFFDGKRFPGGLKELGFPSKNLEQIRKQGSPWPGLHLVSGETGSGKSTTLRYLAAELISGEAKILSAEDPVEIEVPEFDQVEVSPQHNRGFHQCLSSFLRQSPDLMIIGEIRDAETAAIAVEAAFTGHTILSTVHTSGLKQIPARLIELEASEKLLFEALGMGIHQMLIPRACPHCIDQSKALRKCPSCQGTRIKGRTAIFEVQWLGASPPPNFSPTSASDDWRDKIQRNIVLPNSENDQHREHDFYAFPRF